MSTANSLRRRATSMNRRGSHARSRKGFTLVSMIVALVLMGVGVGALARSSAETLKFQNVAQNKTNAIAIGRAYIESVRTRDPWSIAAEGATKVDADGTKTAAGLYTRSMEMAIERQNLVRLTITVKYPRMTDPVVLTTYLYRGNGLAGMGA
jgi:type II secretory pathway pseudopilin PulG